MLRPKLWRDRRGVIAIMFALAILPLILLVSLAVDYSYAIEARSQLNLAADSAAMQAVRVASQTLASGSTVAQATTAGTAAGKQWFAAQVGNITTASVPTSGVTVDLTYTPSPGAFNATVSYSGTVNLQLGLSGVTPTSWTIGGNASAVVSNSFLEVLLMLDNSSSMQIGATAIDMQRMMLLTPCNPISAWYEVNKISYWAGGTGPSGDPYPQYQCSAAGNTYNFPDLPCPLKGLSVPPYASTTLPIYALSWVSGHVNPINGPTCPTSILGSPPPTMGAPCAFACHSDNSKPAGTGNDFYALARAQIGTAAPITLRFDVLKNATNALLSAMATSAETGANLSVGIYAFNQKLSQVYPGSGEAGTDFGAAAAAVGSPPTKPHQPDTGIQPDTLIGDAVHSDTYLNATMAQLASMVKPSGDGTTAASPRKVLFLITDGMEDSCSGGSCPVGTINPANCQSFKDLGYVVYVVYTRYYPLMHQAYLTNGEVPLAEGAGPGSIVNSLQKCATDPTDFVEANDLTPITNALQLFLNTALNGPGRITN